ncbi:RNase adapter RapZ, partial [Paenibacillus xylanexedens]
MIRGMWGGGKRIGVERLEDVGLLCVDNLGSVLIGKLA